MTADPIQNGAEVGAVDLAELSRLHAMIPPGPYHAMRSSDGGYEVRQFDTDPGNKHHWPFRLCASIPGQRAGCDDAVFNFIAGVLNVWDDIEVTRILNMTEEQLNREIIARGDDPEEMVRQSRESISYVTQLVDENKRLKAEAVARTGLSESDAADLVAGIISDKGRGRIDNLDEVAGFILASLKSHAALAPPPAGEVGARIEAAAKAIDPQAWQWPFAEAKRRDRAVRMATDALAAADAVAAPPSAGEGGLRETIQGVINRWVLHGRCIGPRRCLEGVDFDELREALVAALRAASAEVEGAGRPGMEAIDAAVRGAAERATSQLSFLRSVRDAALTPATAIEAGTGETDSKAKAAAQAMYAKARERRKRCRYCTSEGYDLCINWHAPHACRVPAGEVAR